MQSLSYLKQFEDGFFGKHHDTVLGIFKLPVFAQAPDLGGNLPEWIIPKIDLDSFDSHYMRDYI